jgi:uncharacterized protein
LIYLDTHVIIRFIEGDPASREPIRRRLEHGEQICTSQLTRLESRCAPVRNNDSLLLALYDLFFAAAELRVVAIDTRIIDEATSIRAAFNLTSPDAIHLATAVIEGAAVFLTGDRKLAGCNRIPVEII